MSEEARRSRAAYLREWRKKNKDKVKEYNKRYWERKVAKAAAQEK